MEKGKDVNHSAAAVSGLPLIKSPFSQEENEEDRFRKALKVHLQHFYFPMYLCHISENKNSVCLCRISENFDEDDDDLLQSKSFWCI